jgi:Ni,Fe-hydrogenase maturation factor
MTFIWNIGNPNLGNDGIGFHIVQELTQLVTYDAIDIEELEFTEEMTPKVRDAVPPVVKLVLGEISKK